MDFGTRNVQFTPNNGLPKAVFGANITDRLDVVTVGVNYHFR
jgi:hypothetical protein